MFVGRDHFPLLRKEEVPLRILQKREEKRNQLSIKELIQKFEHSKEEKKDKLDTQRKENGEEGTRDNSRMDLDVAEKMVGRKITHKDISEGKTDVHKVLRGNQFNWAVTNNIFNFEGRDGRRLSGMEKDIMDPRIGIMPSVDGRGQEKRKPKAVKTNAKEI